MSRLGSPSKAKLSLILGTFAEHNFVDTIKKKKSQLQKNMIGESLISHLVEMGFQHDLCGDLWAVYRLIGLSVRLVHGFTVCHVLLSLWLSNIGYLCIYVIGDNLIRQLFN